MQQMIGSNFLPIIFGAALLIALIVGSAIDSERSLPKQRIARAARCTVPAGHAAKDLPSIARQQSGFLKRRPKSERFSALALVIRFDRLLQTSGLSISLPRFALVLLLAVVMTVLVTQRLTGFGLLTVAAVVPPLVVLLTMQLLCRRKADYLRRFQSIFPEALDLIVRSVRAGLPVSEAIKMIGTEVADPVGASFREVAANLTIGLSLDDALALLEQKVPIPEVKFFSISLTIQQETGGNLAEILSNLSSIMRKRVQIGKKIRALSSEARASALIIGSLPFFVGAAIFVLNRDYIELLFSTDTGHMFLLAAASSIALGATIMAKLIRFDI